MIFFVLPSKAIVDHFYLRSSFESWIELQKYSKALFNYSFKLNLCNLYSILYLV